MNATRGLLLRSGLLAGASSSRPIRIETLLAAVEFSSSSSSHDGNNRDGRSSSGTSGGTRHSGEDEASASKMKAAAPSRPRPRSPLAMAAFDYQEEVAERIREEGTMPDTEAAFEILANHRIREAMAAGEFDNLKGKGQALDRTEDSSDIAMKVLKNANAAPEWVELGKDIRAKATALRSRIRAWLKANGAAAIGDATRHRKHQGATDGLSLLEQPRLDLPGWKAFEDDEILPVIAVINAEISRHNHMAPTAVVHMMPLRLQAELNAISREDEPKQ